MGNGGVATAEATLDRPRLRLLAGAIGNALEWYDFATYGFLAATFAHNFFPSDDHVASLLAAFGVFAAAFLMRPVGALLFGHIGDRYGRRQALMLSAGTMAASTVVIGLLPTYATAGLLAPGLLVVLRLLQGVSVGGECTTSTVFLVEGAAPGRIGFWGSFSAFGATIGTLLGSAVGAGVAGWFGPQALVDWAWRLPFLFGLVLGAAALVIRRMLAGEPPVAGPRRLPAAEAFAEDWRGMARGFLMSATLGASFYLVFVYLTTFMQQVDGVPPALALQVNTVSMVALAAMIPGFGWLSDRVGRRPVLTAALLGFTVLSVPLFWLLASRQPGLMLAGQLGFAVLVAAYSAVLPVVLAEMFRRSVRCTALSFSFNLGLGLVGGTVPMVAIYLVSRLDDDLGPGIYLAVVALVSLLATTIRPRPAVPL